MEDQTFDQYITCPVCDQIPRRSPIYHCSEACHPICAPCRPPTDKCPTCGKEGLHKSAFAGRFFNKLTMNSLVECPNTSSGCTMKLLGKDLDTHTTECAYRSVKCINCGVSVSLNNLIQHFKDNSCASFVTATEESDSTEGSVVFQTAISGTNQDVFSATTEVIWRPLLLDQTKFKDHLVFVRVVRYPQGLWIITPLTYSQHDMHRNLHIVIVAYGIYDEDTKNRTKFVFHGRVTMVSSAKTIINPNCLMMHDLNVHPLTSKDKKMILRLQIRLTENTET